MDERTLQNSQVGNHGDSDFTRRTSLSSDDAIEFNMLYNCYYPNYEYCCGRAFLNRGRVSNAVEDIERSIRKQPTGANGLFHRSFCTEWFHASRGIPRRKNFGSHLSVTIRCQQFLRTEIRRRNGVTRGRDRSLARGSRRRSSRRPPAGRRSAR